MAGDSLGKLFKITVWGESHGPSVGVVIEGCPPKIKVDLDEIQLELYRRKPANNPYVSPRNEPDEFKIVSGIFEGFTTGTPITIEIKNKSFTQEDYEENKEKYRPGHADFTYKAKYGIRDYFGGGRSSARLTAPIVAAGAVAKQFLKSFSGIEIQAFIRQIGKHRSSTNLTELDKSFVNNSDLFCTDASFERKAKLLLTKLKDEGNSTGGIVECIIENVPVGLGEPLFDKLDADLAKVMIGLNAAKGFEIGSGFLAAELTGSDHNDEFFLLDGKVSTKTNNSGGVLGGISTGMPVSFRVAFKPTPSISQKQKTLTEKHLITDIVTHGQHDVCVAIRAVPVVEALAAVVICDHIFRHRGQCEIK